MTEFTSHVPGTFCWAELSTTDQKAAVAFYRDLFGWSVNDQPIGPDDVYSMLQLDGRDIGAAYTMRAEERQMGAPPHWNLYVAVANADETAARAQELGGTVLAPAFDVMDAGRMAIIQDPAGAIFEVWQPGRHIGARVLGEPGALCWSELSTRDPVAAERFYTRLFGWTSKPSGGDAPMAYTEFLNNGAPGVGMMAMPPDVPPDVPSYWMPYFMVADCDASAAKAKALGAHTIVAPTDISTMGRFAVLTDPQSAMFAVFAVKR